LTPSYIKIAVNIQITHDIYCADIDVLDWLDWQWLAHLTCLSLSEPPSKAPIVSLSKKLYLHCSVLVGSRNRFEPVFSMEVK